MTHIFDGYKATLPEPLQKRLDRLTVDIESHYEETKTADKLPGVNAIA